MVALPFETIFDAHNHVHLGDTSAREALRCTDDESSWRLGGMAVMSTHPRDFERVSHICDDLHINHQIDTVKCFGVHPWFVSELEDNTDEINNDLPQWLIDMEQLLEEHPKSIVGEIGLDGFHFNAETGELSAPMDTQIEVFRYQMELAAKYERPVSVHTVQCFGALMETLSRLKKQRMMPPKVYFHAFGGKIGTIDQLLALCGREVGQVYFGFAPIVNFRSPKTISVIRKVGIERLVLETDHEDAERVMDSMKQGIEYIAAALDISEEELVEQTTLNAQTLYDIS